MRALAAFVLGSYVGVVSYAHADPVKVLFRDEALLKRAEACIVAIPSNRSEPLVAYCNSKLALRVSGYEHWYQDRMTEEANSMTSLLNGSGYRQTSDSWWYRARRGYRLIFFER